MFAPRPSSPPAMVFFSTTSSAISPLAVLKLRPPRPLKVSLGRLCKEKPFPMSNHAQVRSCSWRWPSFSRSRSPASSSTHASRTRIPEWNVDSPLSWLELGASELFGSFVTSCRNCGIHLVTMTVRMNNSQSTWRIRRHLASAISIRLHERANVHVIIVLHLPARWRQHVCRYKVEFLLLPLHTYGFLMH